MNMLKKLLCLRCTYEWFQRTPNKPIKCPNCQSRNWTKKSFHLKAAAALFFLGLFFQGCATAPPSGLDMYADGMDCVAEHGYTQECEALLSHGIAQVTRDSGEAYDPTFLPSVIEVNVR